MHAYARSISMIWLVNTPLSALGFVLVVFIRAYSLHRVVIREGAKTSDREKGEAVEKASDGAGFTEVEGAPTQDDGTEQTPASLGGETAREKIEA